MKFNNVRASRSIIIPLLNIALSLDVYQYKIEQNNWTIEAPRMLKIVSKVHV